MLSTIKPWHRRIAIFAMVIVVAAVIGAVLAQTQKPIIDVWKGPKCGCCKAWVSYLEANGFEVRADDTGNTDARRRLGMPVKYGSCHTAKIGGYVIEGHVPVREIQRLLSEKPDAIGLAVPGMPLGSPGMDGPDYDNAQEPYDVLLVQKDGSTRVFQSYR